MKFSVISVCSNLPPTLAEMVRSVKAQKADVEHIVVDHGYENPDYSLFNTEDHRVSHVEFLPYAWVYEAWNRGLALATGDVVALVHGCDVLADSGVFTEVERTLDRTGADAVYGDLAYVAEDDPDRMMRHWRTGHWTDANLSMGWLPPLPAFFSRREIYERAKQRNGEYFNISLQTDPVCDLLTRLLGRMHISVAYLPRVLTKVRVGSPSSQILANMLSQGSSDNMRNY